MAVDANLETISSGYNISKINSNFQAIDTALQDAVSRSGQAPNQMDADFDMNGNDILNVDNIDVNTLTIDGVPVVVNGGVAVDPDSLVPVGGTDGQVLTKQSGTDFDVNWESVPAGTIGGSTGVTDNRLLRADGVGGSTIQNSLISVDDLGGMTGVTQLTIAAPTNITAYGLDITKNYSGVLAGSTHGHKIMTASDVATLTGANFLNSVTIEHNFGGTGMQGGRQGLMVASIQTGQSDLASSNHNYVAVTPYMQATVNDRGTGVTWATARGGYFALNPTTIAHAAATNLLDVNAAEVNVSMRAGSSSYKKTIMSFVGMSDDAVSGSVIDAMTDYRNMTGAIGWNNAILFHDMEGNAQFPVKTTGTLIKATVNAATTVGAGIDISALTITGNAWASPSVTITGAGVITAPSIGVDANFRSTIVSSNPRITVDSTDYYEYDRTNNGHNFYISGTRQLNINASAVDTPIGYAVGASYVVRSRKAGWGLATGTATRTTFATGSVTLPQLAERVKALIDDLHATAGHGLIGT